VTLWHDMALHAGYRGAEARQLAERLEMEAMEDAAREADYARMEEQHAREMQEREWEAQRRGPEFVAYLERWMLPGWML
jgi:hypothetical protein